MGDREGMLLCPVSATCPGQTSTALSAVTSPFPQERRGKCIVKNTISFWVRSLINKTALESHHTAGKVKVHEVIVVNFLAKCQHFELSPWSSERSFMVQKMAFNFPYHHLLRVNPPSNITRHMLPL